MALNKLTTNYCLGLLEILFDRTRQIDERASRLNKISKDPHLSKEEEEEIDNKIRGNNRLRGYLLGTLIPEYIELYNKIKLEKKLDYDESTSYTDAEADELVRRAQFEGEI